VLDVGCGCGATTIAAAGAGGSALGLDLSGPMLAVARRLAAETGAAGASFEQGDAQVYPLRRGFYDVMISSFGVMFFTDPAAAFANITRALRPRGRLAFLCWQDDARNEIFAIPLCAVRAAGRKPATTWPDLFTDPGRLAELLAGAGCTDVGIESVIEPAWMGSDVADVMSYVRDMRLIRCLAAELGDERLTERALAAVAEQYAARQRPDGVWVRAAAWLVTATRA
jgi:SAM-dependent methyltransferase